jgi:hypothetical protein
VHVFIQDFDEHVAQITRHELDQSVELIVPQVK